MYSRRSCGSASGLSERFNASRGLNMAATIRQSHLKVIPYIMKDLLQAAHPGDYAQRGLHRHPLVPRPTRAQLQMGREAFGTVAADIRQANRPPSWAATRGKQVWAGTLAVSQAQSTTLPRSLINPHSFMPTIQRQVLLPVLPICWGLRPSRRGGTNSMP